MNIDFNRFASTSRALTLAAAVAWASAPMAAQAAIVHYDFSVTVDTSATAFSGQTFSGSFAFDDGVALPGLPGESLFDLTDFRFSFNDVAYTLVSLTPGAAAVFVGTTFQGLDAVGNVFSLLPRSGGFAPFFAFDLGDRRGGNGSVSFTPRFTSVPEPTGVALLLVALGALALVGRRRV